MPSELAGYVADIPYVAGFKPMLSPAWLDFVALLGGVRPPLRDEAFTWCDLGCGHGVSAVVFAATYGAGAFHGVDAMPVHIKRAAALAAAAGATNAHFHAADFMAARELRLPPCDYVVAHGVYTWVDAATRRALRALIDRLLAPGGLVYVSYNTLPGWTRDLPFQYLVRALAADARGDSAARFAAAADFIDRLADAGATSLASSHMVRELREQPADYRPGYLVHEFLHAGWQPLYVTELRRDFAEIGLRPVGSATLIENFDRWVLTPGARRLLAGIADPELRELVHDFCLDQRFRCDVFTRDAPPIDAADQRRRLFDAGLALARPPAVIDFRAPSPAGQLDYDNPSARAIVATLAAGGSCLADVKCDSDPQDLLANALALCAGDDLRPVETRRMPVATLNRALRDRTGAESEIPLVALSCGTALEVDLRLFGSIDDAMRTQWREFLAAHGALPEAL